MNLPDRDEWMRRYAERAAELMDWLPASMVSERAGQAWRDYQDLTRLRIDPEAAADEDCADEIAEVRMWDEYEAQAAAAWAARETKE